MIADINMSTNYGVHNIIYSTAELIHKSARPDIINAVALNKTREVRAHSYILCTIFQCSLQSGVVPNDWKQANFVAVYKKGAIGIPQITNQFFSPALYHKYLKRSSAPT